MMRGAKDGPHRKKPRLAAVAEKSKLSVVVTAVPASLAAAGPHGAGSLPGWPPGSAPVLAANGDAATMPLPSVQVRDTCDTYCLLIPCIG